MKFLNINFYRIKNKKKIRKNNNVKSLGLIMYQKDNYFKKYINFVYKNGAKKQMFNFVEYLIINFKNFLKLKGDLNYNRFLHNCTENKLLLNYNYLFKNIYLKFEMMLKVTSKLMKVKKQKKDKRKYQYEVKYIEKSKRLNNFFKLFYILSQKYNKVNYKKRFLLMFVDNFVSYKYSSLNNYRILTLKYLLLNN